jgi:FKBP-type peptidyl-prolyl cis-trans isomerase
MIISKNIYFIIILSFIFVFFSCKNNKNKLTYQPSEKDIKGYKDTLVRANTFLIQKDKERIESFAKRKNWEMQISKTGLYYEIYQKTNKELLEPSNIVLINYKIELLDGTLCYSSDSTGSKTMKIGKSGEISGLEEGLLLMRIGEKARFIIPPYLAMGLIGDMKKIPARSILVYEIEVLKKIDF